jgi:hypothetical protein
MHTWGRKVTKILKKTQKGGDEVIISNNVPSKIIFSFKFHWYFEILFKRMNFPEKVYHPPKPIFKTLWTLPLKICLLDFKFNDSQPRFSTYLHLGVH